MRKRTNGSKTEGELEVIREANRIRNCVNIFDDDNNNNNNKTELSPTTNQTL